MSDHRFASLLSKRTWIGLVLALLLMGLAFQGVFAAEWSMQPANRADLQLPRLIITLDDTGRVTELSLVVEEDRRIRYPISQLAFLSSILGLNLDVQMFDAATMQALTDANIQHVGIQTGPAGIVLQGNGEFMLGVQWGDEATLSRLADLGEVVQIPLARLATQIVRAIGVDVVIELPLSAGVVPAEQIPFSTGVQFPEPPEMPDIVPVALRATGEYDANGTAYVFGEPLAEWGSLFGADLSMLNLDPSAISVLQEAGVQSVALRMDNSGASLLADDGAVVTVIPGDEETLSLAMRLAEQFQIPFAELIPVAARTKMFNVHLTVDLPSGQ